ncbi:MAG: hypothetical protein Q7U82_10530 [Gammaproteobacteria bacterium]|nr:hypothetical protein [Gammaproteobacteria bacterium]
MTIIDLYPYLIIVGSSILAASAWLLYRARLQTRSIQELVRLNEEVQFDLPDFLRKCWPTLASGNFAGLSWQLDWFGVPVQGAEGVITDRVLQQHFEVQEIGLNIQLYYQKHGWEQRYFSQVIADNLFLLLRMDMWIKLGTIRGTFDQTAKMTVFLQHDMKNLLQLVSLASDQLESPVAGQEGKLMESMRSTIPAIRERASHMLKAFGNEGRMGRWETVDLAEMLRQSCVMYELNANIEGAGCARVPMESLHSIVENLLGNYAWQARQPSTTVMNLRIRIHSTAGKLLTEFEDLNGKPCLWPERLFEPFWSERGKGRGIGLYQSRQLANAADGSLDVRAAPDKSLCFILTLPAAD